MAQWEEWPTTLAPHHGLVCRFVDAGVVTLNSDKLLQARGSFTAGLPSLLEGCSPGKFQTSVPTVDGYRRHALFGLVACMS